MTRVSWTSGPVATAFLPVSIVALSALIFIADTITDMQVAVPVFYAVVVLMSVFAFDRRGVLVLAAGCVALTILSRFLSQRGPPQAGIINFLISLSAIGATTYLVIMIKAAQAAALRARAQIAHLGRLTTLGELTAAIAHEVNQPLAAIVTNSNACGRWLAAQPPNLIEAKLAVERIAKEADRAAQVVQRVRSLARGEPAKREWLDVNLIVLEVLSLMRDEVQRNRIALRTNLDDDVPGVLGDRVQLQQVVLNLLLNAVDALTEVDGGHRYLTVSSMRDTNGEIRVEVSDTGKGPEPADLDRLFDTFYTTKRGGLGMGLAISRSIIEGHGGRIWAAVDRSRGTIFQFSLPSRLA
jgi:signal transduction histidine kinase